MLYTVTWAGVTMTVDINDKTIKDRAERFLDLAITPASRTDTVETVIVVSRSAQGWHFTAPFGPSLLENCDDAVIFLTMSTKI